MKKTYRTPTMQAVVLRQQHYLLAGSISATSTNLSGDDDIGIEETPGDDWGR